MSDQHERKQCPCCGTMGRVWTVADPLAGHLVASVQTRGSFAPGGFVPPAHPQLAEHLAPASDGQVTCLACQRQWAVEQLLEAPRMVTVILDLAGCGGPDHAAGEADESADTLALVEFTTELLYELLGQISDWSDPEHEEYAGYNVRFVQQVHDVPEPYLRGDGWQIVPGQSADLLTHEELLDADCGDYSVCQRVTEAGVQWRELPYAPECSWLSKPLPVPVITRLTMALAAEELPPLLAQWAAELQAS